MLCGSLALLQGLLFEREGEMRDVGEGTMRKRKLLKGLWLRCGGRRELGCFSGVQLGILCRSLFGLLFGLGFGAHVQDR